MLGTVLKNIFPLFFGGAEKKKKQTVHTVNFGIYN